MVTPRLSMALSTGGLTFDLLVKLYHSHEGADIEAMIDQNIILNRAPTVLATIFHL